MLQDSDEEKLSQIFMILFEKKVAKRSVNDFEDSQEGKVVDTCSKTKMEIIKNNKGGVKICHLEYMYTKKATRKAKIQWECSQRTSKSCKA